MAATSKPARRTGKAPRLRRKLSRAELEDIPRKFWREWLEADELAKSKKVETLAAVVLRHVEALDSLREKDARTWNKRRRAEMLADLLNGYFEDLAEALGAFDGLDEPSEEGCAARPEGAAKGCAAKPGRAARGRATKPRRAAAARRE
jgi:hypothetical protein